MKPPILRHDISVLSDQRVKAERRSSWRLVSLLSLASLIASCLPVDTQTPECFPEEPCPRGLLCVEGRCEPPPLRPVRVSFACLSSQRCLETLDARSSISSGVGEGGALCLIVEQSHQLSAYPLELQAEGAQELTIPLSAGALRPSIVFLRSAECPSSEAGLSQRALDLTCAHELDCVIRLRHPQVSAEDMGSAEMLELNFSGPLGQCLDVTWSTEAPQERCDDVDNDCDGFVDEEVSCL